jgi:uncharacterized protein (DUF4415 family)
MTKTKDPICRSRLRQDFPQFVARAECAERAHQPDCEGRRSGRERVRLEGYKHADGYTTRSDGSPLHVWKTLTANIDTALQAIEDDRAAVADADSAAACPARHNRHAKTEAAVSYDRRGAPTERRRGHVFLMATLDGAVHARHRRGGSGQSRMAQRTESSTDQHAATGGCGMTEDQAAATNRLRRKLEILKLDASKVRGQLFHDLQECIALMDIIDKRKED